MKKFLHIISPSQLQVPEALEQRIMSAAALHARRSRCRRQLQLTLPASVAAAAVIFAGVAYYVNLPGKKSPKQEINSKTDLLALADMTALEQGNYTLAAMSEFEFSEDNFIM